MNKAPQELFQLARTALERAGANSRMAEATARHLVRSEAQAPPTHGMSRVPIYCGFLRRGRADGTAQPATGARRFAAEVASAAGIEVPGELLAQIDKLCST